MSEQQSLSTGIEVLKLIVAGGIGGTVASCIGNWFVNKKLQAQKHEHEKRIIEYTSLHDRQAQIIADFYAQLAELYRSIEHLMATYEMRERKEAIEKEHPYIPRSKQRGWTPEEKQAVDTVKAYNKELFEFYRKNKIYLSPAVCELTDRFCTLASYLAINYHNVTFKDEDGYLFVNPEVKEVWDKAIETIPKLLTQLEKEFRDILGVKF